MMYLMLFACRCLRRINSAALGLGLLLVSATFCEAQAPLPIYTDHLVNGFQDWSWGTRNLQNTTPVHMGTNSISFTGAQYTALSFEHPDFSATPYANLT